MAIPTLVELASLPTYHPRLGVALVKDYAGSAVYRLSVDPTAFPSGTIAREVSVHRLDPPPTATATEETLEIGWTGLAEISSEYLATLPYTTPESDLTERAAITVMAAILGAWDVGELLRVLPIGSGGDYLLQVKQRKNPIQIEISSIRHDESGSKSWSRLGEKGKQVLTNSVSGFASVTAFSHPPAERVLSYLHYFSKRSSGERRKRPRKT
jgi:hypothetical protein